MSVEHKSEKHAVSGAEKSAECDDLGDDDSCKGQSGKFREDFQDDPELQELKETKVAAPGGDGPPDDVRAFFGHPLTAATSAINGEEHPQASAMALLHEYANLPAIDRTEAKISDKLSLLLKQDKRDGSEGLSGLDAGVAEYLQSVLSCELDSENSCESLSQVLAILYPKVKAEPAAQVEVNGEHTSEANCVLPQGLEPPGEPAKQENEDRRPTITTTSTTHIQTQQQPQNTHAVVTTAASKTQSPDLVPTFEGHPFPSAPRQPGPAVTGVAAAAAGAGAGLESAAEATPSPEGGPLQPDASLVPQTPSEGGVPAASAAAGTENGEEKRNDVSKEALKALKENLMRKRLSQPEMTNHGMVETAGLPGVTGYPGNQGNNHLNGLGGAGKMGNYPLKPEEGSFIEQLNRELPPVYELTNGMSTPVTSCVTGCGGVPMSLPHGQNPQGGQADSLIVQSSQGQYFQVLQPVQGLEVLNSPDCMNSVYYGQTAYPPYQRQPNDGSGGLDDKNSMLSMVDRYVQQQYAFQSAPPQPTGLQQQQQYPGPYLPPTPDTYSLKSPDSGFQEPCLSPSNNANGVKEVNGAIEGAAKEKAGTKRRRNSQVAVFSRQFSASEKIHGASSIVKLENDTTGFRYFLETPTSTTQRIEEDRITYLNKGQYYTLTLECNPADRPVKSQLVKSVIAVVFREEKSQEDEMRAWNFWHSRQHSYKQRILDIDTKNSQGVSASNIDEFAFNAAQVRWNPRDGPVKVNIATHCLSTDFSNQKGVKGIPLHIQIDTFESPKDTFPINRGYLQIKVFCDKGAERKTRDEERRRAAKTKGDNFNGSSRKKQEDTFHPPCDRSEFYTMADLLTPPAYFTPDLQHIHNGDQDEFKACSDGQSEESSSLPSLGDGSERHDECFPAGKRARRDSCSHCRDHPKVLLYVRERHEKVFTALLLETSSMMSLLRAIEEKYQIPTSKVKNFYKKSKKGILVRMDDNIVRHYSHESTFIIELNVVSEDRDYEVVLVEIDPQ